MAGAAAAQNAGGGEERARIEALFSALDVVLMLVDARPCQPLLKSTCFGPRR
ncbi:MAG: hypothetical protein AMXMBFR34_54630 [Myxococcaceae bacterium]